MTALKPLSRGEFVALMAALSATVAVSIDAMLPALPEIAASLSPDAPNRAQLVVTSFVFGMGLGTLFAGPLSDAFGRKAMILAGSTLYIGAAIACFFANSLDLLLVARVVQGFGAAFPRIVSIALMRDMFKGREMAKVMSFVMMVFALVPAVAPLMGQAVISVSGWQTIFLVYIGFATITMIWLGLRQPETLPVAARRPLSVGKLISATREVLSHRIVLIAIVAQMLTLGCLFATLSSMQGIFEHRFNRADSFPMWFAVIALCSTMGSIINARVVVKRGMRAVVVTTYTGILALTLVMLVSTVSGIMPEALAFPAHILWSIALFAMMSLTLGNLNALAMEPLGHLAGIAASVTSALATVGSVLLAVPVGLALDGTQVPLMVGVAVFSGLSLLVMQFARR
jgi:DHA1 family bicyclomycin/chloramphenicol resistance-like MFS transporter